MIDADVVENTPNILYYYAGKFTRVRKNAGNGCATYGCAYAPPSGDLR